MFNNLKKICIASLASIGILFSSYSFGNVHGTIVILNGTSSAGKSSLVQELLKIYGSSYTTLNGDDFLETYFEKHPVPANITAEEDIELASQAACALYNQAKEISLTGKNVFVDVVRFDDEYEKYSAILGTDKVIKILVYCPLDSIFQNVAKRNKSGIEKEQRSVIPAFWQFIDIYTLKTAEKQLVVDRVSTRSLKKALEKAQKELTKDLRKEPEDIALKIKEQNKQFYQNFIQHFKLDTLTEIVLVPKNNWDLVITTGTYSLEYNAKIVEKYITQQSIIS